MPDFCRAPRAPAVSAPAPAGPAVVIQLARLGDFLQTTGLLAALARQGREASVLVTPAQAPLARGCRFAGRVAVLDTACLEDAVAAREPANLRLARLGGLLAPAWRLPAGEVYNLNLSRLCALTALGWPGARVRGWRLDPDSGELTGEAWSPFVMRMAGARRLTRLHLTDILASYAEPETRPLDRLDYRVDPKARRRAAALVPPGGVVLQLGANNDLRRWPLDSFAELARALLALGHGVILTGSSREQVLGRRLQRALGAQASGVCDLMGRTDLPTLAGVLQSAGLVVAADTGTLHLAAAVGAKVLALFMGPAQVHETGPYGAGILTLQARDQCGPCQEHNPVCRGRAPCRRLITPAAVLAASKALLAGADAARAAEGLPLPQGAAPLEGVLDDFGQRYRFLRPVPLSTETGLAWALREAGRALLRPSYGPAPGGVRAELDREHLPPEEGAARQLQGLAAAAGRLAGAALAGDAGAAGRIMASAPGLRPLGMLVGPGMPERLAAACRLAARVMEEASAF